MGGEIKGLVQRSVIIVIIIMIVIECHYCYYHNAIIVMIIIIIISRLFSGVETCEAHHGRPVRRDGDGSSALVLVREQRNLPEALAVAVRANLLITI